MAEMFEITDFKPKIKNQVIKIKQQDLRLQCPFKLTVSGKRFTFYIILWRTHATTMQAMYFWRIHQRGCAEGVDADARPVAWYRRLRTQEAGIYDGAEGLASTSPPALLS